MLCFWELNNWNLILRFYFCRANFTAYRDVCYICEPIDDLRASILGMSTTSMSLGLIFICVA